LNGSASAAFLVENWRSFVARSQPEEFARLVGREAFTCREYCRLGRIRALKKASGRGKYASWVIPHDELLRFQREGLLPDRRRQPNTASTA
jgi:hypothetical protein